MLGRVDAIVHGTTVGDNTLIEMNGAVTGLLTTAGFRDELELRRGYKEDIWDVRLPPPHPIVPRRRRLGVPERILFDGSVAQATRRGRRARGDRAARAPGRRVGRDRAALLVREPGAREAPRRARRARRMPGVPISLSHEVLPKAPEFERTSTTVVNAYIGPRVSRLPRSPRGDACATRATRASCCVMQSSGGVMTREYLRDGAGARARVGSRRRRDRRGALRRRRRARPICSASTWAAPATTSRWCGDGAAPAQPGWNWHHRYVVGLPMVSVETLGAGGGSICDARGGALHVGPASAGADPGPVCYGRGGTQPTVTDASLVLGPAVRARRSSPAAASG